MKMKVIGIVGPTASGKTALSLQVAQRLHGEIICMDSMQIYRGMDIGTAKPTREERARVPHHMLDILPPEASYSVSQYARDAGAVIEKTAVPLLVGGTGMYLQSLSLPMEYGAAGGDEAIRRKYHQLADEQGPQKVHDRLRQIDPVSAERLHPNDLRRVIRAIEVFEITGVPLSRQKMPSPADAPFDFRLFALDLPRDILYRRIDERVDQMMANGLLDEVRRLLEGGLPADAQSMQGLGYKEMVPVLRGDLRLEDAVALLKVRTRHYAKRQLTWFRRDPRIRWLPWQPGQDLSAWAGLICEDYSKGEPHGSA